MAKTPSPLGKNIRALREQKGKTQLELAHAIGLKGTDAGAVISRYESGVYEPRLEKLQKIARALDCDLDTLILGK